MFSYLQSGQEVPSSTRPTPCWRNLAPCIQLTSSISHARRCPDSARARSDMIRYQSLFFHTSGYHVSRYGTDNAFMTPSCHSLPLPPPPPFIVTRTFGHECLYMTYIQHPRTLLHLYTTYALFLGTVRAVPLVLLAYLAFSMNCGVYIPTNLTALFTTRHYLHLWKRPPSTLPSVPY